VAALDWKNMRTGYRRNFKERGYLFVALMIALESINSKVSGITSSAR
jgi:hypothetical protein